MGEPSEAIYARDSTDPALIDLRYLHMVTSNVPAGGTTSPYIDPRPNDDSLPFYWTRAQDNSVVGGNKGAGTYRFFDTSSRTPSSSSPTPLLWRGELYLTNYQCRDHDHYRL